MFISKRGKKVFAFILVAAFILTGVNYMPQTAAA